MANKETKKRRSGAVRNAIVFSLIIGFALGCAFTFWLNNGFDRTARVASVDATATPIPLEAVDESTPMPILTEAPAVTAAPEVPEETEDSAVSSEDIDPELDMAAGDTVPEDEETEIDTEADLDMSSTVSDQTAAEPTEAPAAAEETTEVVTKQFKVSAGYTAPLEAHVPVGTEVMLGTVVDETAAAEELPAEGGIMEVTETPTPAPTEEPVGDVDYGNVTFNIRVTRYMDPDYFASRYASTYQLSGTEAAIEFEVVLDPGDSGILSVSPQDVLTSISVVMSDGSIDRGYNLLSKEIGSDAVSNPKVVAGNAALLCKRFDYPSAEGVTPKYLRVVTAVEGQVSTYDFALVQSEVGYSVIRKGDKGDTVMALQNKLIALGFMEGPADGDFGSKTEAAIAKAQAALGLSQTGVADVDFQKRLYAVQVEVPAATEAPAQQTQVVLPETLQPEITETDEAQVETAPTEAPAQPANVG